MTSYKEHIENSEILRNLYFIVIALLLAFGTLQLAGTTLSTDKPVVSVVSCSMYPQYNVGDILFVQGQEFSSIQTDDVIVYDVWSKANITINDETYQLEGSKEHPQPTVETSIGELQLLEVQSGFETQERVATVRVNEEIYTLTEGQSVSHEGTSFTVQSLSGIEIPIVHRVIDKQETYLETKGDNNEEQLDFEKNVKEDQIHGTVVGRIPLLGNVKIVTMDLLGLTGGQPFQIDSLPKCQQRV